TSEFCHWHLPQSHYLEAWGDGRAHDGTATLVQPLIEPLYDSRSAIEVLSFLAGGPDAEAGAGRDLVEARWAGDIAAGGGSWRRALHDGFPTGTGAAAAAAALDEAAVAAAGRALAARLAAPAGLELSFRSDPTLWDGRFANLGWLQECPKPVSKLAWDNPLFVSPATARRLGIETEQVVRVSAGERSLELPVWVLPGQADDHLSIHLGGGRRRAG